MTTLNTALTAVKPAIKPVVKPAVKPVSKKKLPAVKKTKGVLVSTIIGKTKISIDEQEYTKKLAAMVKRGTEYYQLIHEQALTAMYFASQDPQQTEDRLNLLLSLIPSKSDQMKVMIWFVEHIPAKDVIIKMDRVNGAMQYSLPLIAKKQREKLDNNGYQLEQAESIKWFNYKSINEKPKLAYTTAQGFEAMNKTLTKLLKEHAINENQRSKIERALRTSLGIKNTPSTEVKKQPTRYKYNKEA